MKLLVVDDYADTECLGENLIAKWDDVIAYDFIDMEYLNGVLEELNINLNEDKMRKVKDYLYDCVEFDYQKLYLTINSLTN